jgi:hypothetical protein
MVGAAVLSLYHTQPTKHIFKAEELGAVTRHEVLSRTPA